mmetsp:Transcript_25309/g.58787  ORF Transcript_25309/g.58787 Transcript_25309/m.58787 type:complete len:843 (-) Transcript_25309:225-2753(-)
MRATRSSSSGKSSGKDGVISQAPALPQANGTTQHKGGEPLPVGLGLPTLGQSALRKALQQVSREQELLEDQIGQLQLRAGRVRHLINGGLMGVSQDFGDSQLFSPLTSYQRKVNSVSFKGQQTPLHTASGFSNLLSPHDGGLTESVEQRELDAFSEGYVFDPDDPEGSFGGNAGGSNSMEQDAYFAVFEGDASHNTTTSLAQARLAFPSQAKTDGRSKSFNISATSKGSLRPYLLEVFGEGEHVGIGSYLREDMINCPSQGTDMRQNVLVAKLKRARTGDVRVETESRWQWLVMKPSCRKRAVWDILSTFIVLYDLFLIPYEAFSPPLSLTMVLLDWVTTCFWLMDMGASCITGYFEEGVVEMRLPMVVRRYLRSWFVTDAIAVFADLIIIILGTNLQAASVLRLSKTARFVRVLRFLRLARLKKVHRAMTELMDKVQSEYFRIIIRVGFLLLSLIILNHYVACAWYALGHNNWFDFTITWIKDHETDDDSRMYWYTTSLHWSLTQFTPASMEVHATNASERVFSVLVLLFALVAFSSFLSSITASMAYLRQLQKEWLQQESALRKYFLQNDISAELGQCILKYFTARRRSKVRRRYQENELPILSLLPEHLISRVHEELYLPAFVQHPLFEYYGHLCTPGINEICHRAVSMRHVSDGETVFYEAEVAESMYFATRTSMDYCCTLNVDPKLEPAVELLEEGQWCSEHALWMHWCHCGRLLGKEYGECLEVNGEACRKVMLADYHVVARELVTSYARSFADCVLGMDQEQLTDLVPAVFTIQVLLQKAKDSNSRSEFNSESNAANKSTNFVSALAHLASHGSSNNSSGGSISQQLRQKWMRRG